MGIPASTFRYPNTIIAKAKTDPTDKSIPPIKMTKVMPTAMIPKTVI